MPRVYTTLLKVTRIRLRISMTDCASLTSVCVAVADDAILTCSAEWPRARQRGGLPADNEKLFLKDLNLLSVGDGMVGIPVSAVAFAELHPAKHRQLRAIASARPARRAEDAALHMDATSFHDLDALAVRCITDFLSPRQLAIATRTCHELCTACAGEPSRAHQAGRSEGPSASLLKRHAMPSP